VSHLYTYKLVQYILYKSNHPNSSLPPPCQPYKYLQGMRPFGRSLLHRTIILREEQLVFLAFVALPCGRVALEDCINEYNNCGKRMIRSVNSKGCIRFNVSSQSAFRELQSSTVDITQQHQQQLCAQHSRKLRKYRTIEPPASMKEAYLTVRQCSRPSRIPDRQPPPLRARNCRSNHVQVLSRV
jgi:hypothetical protein